MTRHSFRTALDTLNTRRPFRAYVVYFTDGHSLTVQNAEALWYRGAGTAVYFHESGEMTLFDEEGVTKITSGRKVVAS